MIRNNIVKVLLDQAASLAALNSSRYIGISAVDHIYEFQHVGLILPRQSGKSTAANYIEQNYSATVVRKVLDLDRLVFLSRGASSRGLKYQFIVLDDLSPEYKSQVPIVLHHLLIAKQLADNFCLITLETPQP